MKSIRLGLVVSVLLSLGCCYNNALDQTLQQLRVPKDNDTRFIFASPLYCGPHPSSFTSLANYIISPSNISHGLEAGLFEGLFIRNRTTAMPGQAVAAILFNSFFTMTYTGPNQKLEIFDWVVSYPDGGVRFPLNAWLHVESANLSKPYELTNSRLSVALSTLGNHFNEHWDLNHMHEWEFDIAICYFSIGAIKIIGRGSIVQGLPPQNHHS